MNRQFAPIVIFAYNRADHLKKTIECLLENDEARQSECYIFSDGPKNKNAESKINEVRDYIHDIQDGSFKKVVCVEAKENKGLAKSIIEGVSTIIESHGRAIVVEDDVLTSKYFLKFMNEALDYYQNNSRIWSIGGYTVPLKLPADYPHEVIVTQRCSSYCWATWKDRWQKIDWGMTDYERFRFNPLLRRQFNRFGNDRALMLDDQKNSRVDSWAIRFDYNMWKSGMLNILPAHSLANNIGHDGSGTHSTVKDESSTFAIEAVSNKVPRLEDVPLSEEIIAEYVKFFNMPLGDRVKRFWGNVFYKVRHKV